MDLSSTINERLGSSSLLNSLIKYTFLNFSEGHMSKSEYQKGCRYTNLGKFYLCWVVELFYYTFGVSFENITGLVHILRKSWFWYTFFLIFYSLSCIRGLCPRITLIHGSDPRFCFVALRKHDFGPRFSLNCFLKLLINNVTPRYI
ncbi:hypothetical protein Lalb_Chr17g0342861 [Lupinus albus]|uniref:Uncharacterized protein n=1 Tax=Lupinus albus TaxID=3870 RepID=A0A6A4NQ01_LUPAL|nr:hypothetical protein Lalb_Chr17g0342861 [Lupinus albus]